MTIYRSLVGRLMFLTNARPDNTYVVSVISRYISDPTEDHMKATIKIMRYIKGTSDFGIHYYKHIYLKEMSYHDIFICILLIKVLMAVKV